MLGSVRGVPGNRHPYRDQSNMVNKTDHEKSLIQRQIDTTDKQID